MVERKRKEAAMRLLKTENRKIAVEELNISDAYQRTIVPGRVNRITKSLDQDAFGSLTVGERGDGSLWVVDGMQRLTAARKLGIGMVPCDVFESDGQEHEARVFRLKNKERTNVSAGALFNAQLTEGDAQTKEIVSVVARVGLKIRLKDGGGSGWPYIAAVKALERSYQRIQSEGLFDLLSILCEVWPGEDGAIQGDMIEGMSLFIKKNAGYDRRRLVEKLRVKAVSTVVRAADATFKLEKERSSDQYGRAAATCDAITVLYRRGLRRSKTCA
jgi:hypothetical protein